MGLSWAGAVVDVGWDQVSDIVDEEDGKPRIATSASITRPFWVERLNHQNVAEDEVLTIKPIKELLLFRSGEWPKFKCEFWSIAAQNLCEFYHIVCCPSKNTYRKTIIVYSIYKESGFHHLSIQLYPLIHSWVVCFGTLLTTYSTQKESFSHILLKRKIIRLS